MLSGYPPRNATLCLPESRTRGLPDLSVIADNFRDVVLTCISRFEKLNHGVGFGRAIVNGVMGKDDPVDEDHSLFFLGLKADAIVYEDGTGIWNRAGKRLLFA